MRLTHSGTKGETIKEMLPFLLILTLFVPTPRASAKPTPTPVPELKEEFARLNTEELPEVIVYGCGSHSKPCNKLNGSNGCVPRELDEGATKRACDQYAQLLKEIYKLPCYSYVLRKPVFLGWTKNDSQCAKLKAAWDEVNELISNDPALKDNSLEWRASLFRNTLLDPKSRKQKAVVANQLQFRKNGKARRNQTRDMNHERLMAMILANFDEYKEERHCGPGLLPMMDRVPMVNQRQQGTCFAHSAASMTDYVVRYQQAKNSKEYGSPLMVAIDYTWGTDNETCSSSYDPMRSGHTCAAFNEAFKRGFCNKESVENAIIRYSVHQPTSGDIDAKKWSNKLKKEFPEDFEKKLESLESDKILRFLYMIGDLFEKKEWTKLRQLQLQLKQNGDPAGSFTSCFQNATDAAFDPQWWLASSMGSLTLFYKTFFDGVCVREPYDFSVSCNSKFYSLPNHPTESEIDQAIESKYPVGISYCSNVLGNRSYTLKKSMKDGKETDDCDRHASMIVGTALDDKGRCTYVVRNSWGTSCSYYDKDYTCKDGNIFVPKETLLKQVYGFDTLSNQPR